MNPISIIKYQLHLFQLENYELWRFWKLLFIKGLLPKEPQRQGLVWTVKAFLVAGLSFVLAVGVAFGIIYFLNSGSIVWLWYTPLVVILIYLFSFFGFMFFSISLVLLWPVETFVKFCIILWAKEKFKKNSNLKVIGIAGSYGKTTMKQVLAEVLSAKFNVIATPGSVNTPLGIARWIMHKLDNSVDLAIVEMGEHYVGDVEALCKITPPDVVVITGINEAHLERMGNVENVESTIFEAVSYSKPGATIFLNHANIRVRENFKKYIWPDHKVEFYGQADTKEEVLSYEFDSQKLGWDIEVKKLGKFFVSLLGEYAVADTEAAIKVAKILGMEEKEIVKGLVNVKPVEHRLEPINSSSGVLVIDDSYNGNPAGVSEAIKVLSRFGSRRKIYITPGLVEIGKEVKAVHIEIGRELATVVDLVILIKNSVTPYIEMGLMSAKFPKEKILWFNSAQTAHAELKNILKPNDVILFQNDWGDQYV